MKVFLLFVGVCLTGLCYGSRIRRADDDGDYVCPDGSGNFADPKTCRRFYQCVDHHPYVNRCPSGLYFDDIQKFCTFKDEARCGPIVPSPAAVETEEELAAKAKPCDPANCEFPNCFCSSDGTRIPGDLEREKVPQLILISMDDSVNQNNIESYRRVFKNRVNPNGCPILGTFFIAHEYSNYHMIQELHHEGHEIATYSVTHRKNFDDLSYEELTKEQVGVREILHNFANVSKDDILGMRSPHLKPGRNAQFDVLSDFGYVWDSSMSVPPTKTPVWPYTLDYVIPHECRSGTCPTKSYPGVWEFPMNSHYIESFDGGFCPYLDQCVLHNSDASDVFEWLKEDFLRSYDQNRAPYSMAFHTSWFQQKTLENGLAKFLDWVSTQPDVWFVTYTQALLWITDPQPLEKLKTFESWDCNKRTNIPPSPCKLPSSCPLPLKVGSVSDTRYLTTCSPCPKTYPWLGDAAGKGKEPDVYKP